MDPRGPTWGRRRRQRGDDAASCRNRRSCLRTICPERAKHLLVLAILDWEADFSGISVAVGILVDIVIYALAATLCFVVVSTRKRSPQYP